MIRNSWYVAGMSTEFVRELRKRVIAGLPMVMWRADDGEVVAYEGRCSHKRFPLWDGKLLDDGRLRCPYHGWCYDAAGHCVDMPAQPDVPISPAAHLRPYPVVEQDGLVWVWPGDREAVAHVKPPRAPEVGDPANYDAVASEPIELRANWRLLIENLLDITHFFPLHEATIGDRANSEIPVGIVQEEVDGNRMVMTTRQVTNYVLPPYFQRWFDLTEVDREHTHCMMNPGIVRVQLRLAPPGRLGTEDETGYIIYHTTTPVDDQHLEWHWIMACGAGEPFPANPEMRRIDGIAETFPDVVEEDKWGLVRQQEMLDIELGGYRETNIKSDIGVIHARRILARMHQAENHKTELFLPPTMLKDEFLAQAEAVPASTES
jgi:vanillate O-demethylase monooxygenase subunit